MSKIQRQSPARSPAKTKKDRILSLLKRKAGASIAHIEKETGWQPHTVRSALSRLRQEGLSIKRSREGQVSRYHLRKVGGV